MNEIIVIGKTLLRPKGEIYRENSLVTRITIGESIFYVDTSKVCTKDIVSDCEVLTIKGNFAVSNPADSKNLPRINHGKFRCTIKALHKAHKEALNEYITLFKARGYVLIDEVSNE